MIAIVLVSLLALVSAEHPTGCLVQFESRQNVTDRCANGLCGGVPAHSETIGKMQWLSEPCSALNEGDVCEMQIALRLQAMCGLCIPQTTTCRSIEANVEVDDSMFCGGDQTAILIDVAPADLEYKQLFSRQLPACPYLV